MIIDDNRISGTEAVALYTRELNRRTEENRRRDEAMNLLAEWREQHEDPDEDPPVDVLYDWADRAAALLEEMFGEG